MKSFLCFTSLFLLAPLLCLGKSDNNKSPADSAWKVFIPKIPNNVPPEAYCINSAQKKGVTVFGDFDGDGIKDKASLEDNDKLKKRRLAVFFGKNKVPFIVEEKTFRYSGDYLKTGKAKKGKDSILYGSCEASQVILTWDESKKKFLEKWVSD